MKQIHVKIDSEVQMADLAADLLSFIPSGTVILLSGDLGVGKTVFARGFVRAACSASDMTVASPTFNMVSMYETSRGPVYHYDLYRVKDETEIYELGIEDVYTARATLMEWPDRLPPALAQRFKHRLHIDIRVASRGTESRDVTLTVHGLGVDVDTAFIFAAGLGTRMRDRVRDVPKPLVPVAGKPTLDYFITQAKDAGLTRLFLNTHYLPHKIDAFMEGYKDQFDVQIFHEEKLLETGGGLRHALHFIKRDIFYAMNGDALLDEGPGLTMLDRLALAFDPERMDILLLLSPIQGSSITKSVGDYHMDKDGRLIRALDLSGDYMFAGLRLLHARVFDGVNDGIFSFRDQMDEAQQKGRLYGLVHTGLYHHISTPEDVDAVSDYIVQKSSDASPAVSLSSVHHG